MNNKKIVWEDLKQKSGFFEKVVLFVVFLIFEVLFIICLFIWFDKTASVMALMLAIISSLFFILDMRLKYISIEKNGLWTGNNTSGQFLKKLFFLKQKNTFLKWEEISKIELTEKIYAVSYGGGMKLFVVIKLRNDKEYECLIADPKGFINALKMLKKSYLLSGDSKYK